jgi:hypothetical protein
MVRSRSHLQAFQERLSERKAPRLEKKTSRTDRAQQVAEEYADDQREIIKKLRKPTN